MAPRPTNDRIVVGIDFGTTFSGVAFTYSANPESPDEIAVIKNWPGSNGITSEKVPSELTYISQSGAPPNSTNVKWGYQLKPEQARLRCLKLLLDRSQGLPSYVSRSDLLEQLRQSGKTPIDAVSDYISLLVKQTGEELVKRYGASFVQSTKVDYVLTVPAVWSDAAKDATLKAAQKAGTSKNLRLISEPEAAAVYALQTLQHADLRAGDNFIVCDAGGGTVDLISYEITQLSPLRLAESVPGSGGLCGAAFLNLRFEEFVRKLMGDEAFRTMCEQKPKTWAGALHSFESHVKRNFNPIDQEDDYDDTGFHIPFAGLDQRVAAAAGIREGFLAVSSENLTELFEPIIVDVIELVRGQKTMLELYGKSPKGVILVGGFGQSNYLFESLKSSFSGDELPPPYTAHGSTASGTVTTGLSILKPTNSWTAVVRGAVLRGLEGQELVASRKSRRHYGIKFREPFNPSLHSMDVKVWDDLEETYKAQNQISWYIKRGDTVSSTQPILFPFYHVLAEGKQISVDLMVSEAEQAPSEYRSASDLRTRVLCKLDVDLRNVPAKHWQHRRTSGGTQFKKIDYHVGMQIESGGLYFDVRVDGVVYGRLRADFE